MRSVPSIRTPPSMAAPSSPARSSARSVPRSARPSIRIDNLTLSEVGGLSELATPWYSDQILPFDITLAGSNEYGAQAASKIFGVEILNEGSGISIDDAVSEMQATFAFRRRSSNKPGPRLPPPSRSLSSLPGKCLLSRETLYLRPQKLFSEECNVGGSFLPGR